eukprot:s1333_g3.t1
MACPWDYGYAMLGHRMVYSKNLSPPLPFGVGSGLPPPPVAIDVEAVQVQKYAECCGTSFGGCGQKRLDVNAVADDEASKRQKTGEEQPVTPDDSMLDAGEGMLADQVELHKLKKLDVLQGREKIPANSKVDQLAYRKADNNPPLHLQFWREGNPAEKGCWTTSTSELQDTSAPRLDWSWRHQAFCSFWQYQSCGHWHQETDSVQITVFDVLAWCFQREHQQWKVLMILVESSFEGRRPFNEDGENPFHDATIAERDVAIKEARDAHQWVQGFFKNQNAGGAVSSSHVNAVADQMINMVCGHGDENEEESDATSDDAMETASERLHRYLNSEHCEVFDPEEWHVLHFGLGSPVANDHAELGEETDR